MSETESIQYWTEQQVFETARAIAEDTPQKEIARHLEVTPAAVSKMLSGESKMISLAVRWIEMNIQIMDWGIETDGGNKPVRYYKAVQVLDEDDPQ